MSEPSTLAINSFYYFFSAVPQVLGGILALFGVFIIFKIQTMKTQLIGIGQTIHDEFYKTNPHPILNKKKKSVIIIDEIKEYVYRNDILKLQRTIDYIDNIEYSSFILYKIEYNQVFRFLDYLTNLTMYWSMVTGATIIICLSVIPFGKYFLNNPPFLHSLFFCVIILILLCIGSLIYILSISINESGQPLVPQRIINKKKTLF